MMMIATFAFQYSLDNRLDMARYTKGKDICMTGYTLCNFLHSSSWFRITDFCNTVKL